MNAAERTIYNSKLQTGKESSAFCILQRRETVAKHTEERDAIAKASPP